MKSVLLQKESVFAKQSSPGHLHLHPGFAVVTNAIAHEWYILQAFVTP